MIPAPQFKLHYDGASEYRWNGKLYEVRHKEAQTQREPDHRLIGCAYGLHGTQREFPPAEFMAHFPGYIPAAYVPTGEQYDFETTCGTLRIDRCEWQFGGTPDVVDTPYGRMSRAARDRCYPELQTA